MQQGRTFRDHIPNRLDVITPDGIDQTAHHHETRPIADTVATGEHQLRIVNCGRSRLDGLGMMLAQLLNRHGVAARDRAKEICRLLLQLVEPGPDGKWR